MTVGTMIFIAVIVIGFIGFCALSITLERNANAALDATLNASATRDLIAKLGPGDEYQSDRWAIVRKNLPVFKIFDRSETHLLAQDHIIVEGHDPQRIAAEIVQSFELGICQLSSPNIFLFQGKVMNLAPRGSSYASTNGDFSLCPILSDLEQSEKGWREGEPVITLIVAGKNSAQMQGHLFNNKHHVLLLWFRLHYHGKTIEWQLRWYNEGGDGDKVQSPRDFLKTAEAKQLQSIVFNIWQDAIRAVLSGQEVRGGGLEAPENVQPLIDARVAASAAQEKETSPGALEDRVPLQPQDDIQALIDRQYTPQAEQRVFCSKCGKELPGEAKFCWACGEAVHRPL